MISITVACAPVARVVFEQTLDVADDATLRDSVESTGLFRQFPELDLADFTPGIWGRAADWNQTVKPGDRIELCRALKVDPKVARRQRFKQQGSKGAGLFAQSRPGGKAGY